MTTYLDGLDWSPLEFDANPVPGDPAGVNGLAAELEALGEDAHAENQHLRSIGGSTSEFWEGPAASVVLSKISELPRDLGDLVASYQNAAKAFRGYAAKLQDAQDRIHRALLMAQQAQSDVTDAQAHIAAVQGQVARAGSAYNQAVAAQTAPLPPGAPPLSAGQTAQMQAATDSAHIAYQQAQSQAQSAAQELSAAQSRLEQAKQMAGDAVRDGHNAASALDDQLSAASAGIF